MIAARPVGARETSGKRVAYVLDDEAQVAAFVCSALATSGYQARQFANPVSLFVETRAIVPDLIVLDLALGQSDAVEVIRYLDVMKYRGSVLLISGRDASMLSEIEQIGRNHGLAMLRSLQKPFRVNDLKGRLEQAVEPGSAPAEATTARDPAAKMSREIVIDLEQAHKNGWLELWYQPKIDLKSLSVCGAEALLRARHPEFGIVSPANLLPPAGDPAHQALSRFVIRRAMADWDHFADREMPLKLAVNVPASIINTPEFIPLVREMLPKHPKFPGLIVEVTEDEIIRDATQVREIATQLKLYNTWISIDDFGAAHSSLLRLIDLPCAELKLDIRFVSNCSSDPLKRAVCVSVIELAHRFGASVCAEGVETAEDLRCLREIGCDTAQGFLFARPMAPEKFVQLLLAPPQSVEPAVPAAHAPKLAHAR